MMHKIRDLGFASLLMSYLFMIYFFLLAYFNPERIVAMRINRYGEANIEFLWVIVSIPAVFYYIKNTD